ncbi:hypothetical protein C8T65DRAFT_646130 [Cerioporus squamosus]|nr:hypothetical protein C8T65DRAFT_646130 [Cerioporus squamosus]
MDHNEEYDRLHYEEEENYNHDESDSFRTVPVVRLYTTEQLHTLIREGMIDLSPASEGEVVWPEEKQTMLLDSIWRNYYIPPIVFAVIRDEDGQEVRCCVDGKQRLTSIQNFFDGQIPYRHWRTGRSWWYTSSRRARRSGLLIPNQWKADFANKTIQCEDPGRGRQ